MQPPKFTLEDIRYAADAAMFKRAEALYRGGKVGEITEIRQAYTAQVAGTEPYTVSIARNHVDSGDCNCYMGEQNMLCKHQLALCLAVLHTSGKADTDQAKASPAGDLKAIKSRVTAGFAKLTPYRGPSSSWFRYQGRLASGAAAITDAISNLPPAADNASYLWNIIGRIDRKLMNGLDDSDGIVGKCSEAVLTQLAGYADDDPALVPLLEKFCHKKTHFCFEEALWEKLNRQKR